MAQSYQNYRDLIQSHYEKARENGDDEKEEILEEFLDIYDSLADFDGVLELVKNRNELEKHRREVQDEIQEVLSERERTALSGHSLEEFVGQILKDTANHFDLEITKGKVPAWLGFSPKGLSEEEFVVRDFKMNADVAVGKNVEVELGGEDREVFVPLVYIECKSYVDFSRFESDESHLDKVNPGE